MEFCETASELSLLAAAPPPPPALREAVLRYAEIGFTDVVLMHPDHPAEERVGHGEAGPDVVRRIAPKRIHQMVPVRPTTDLEDALALMRRAGRHLAQVRDDDGRTIAVLFLEDIIEELVGEVQDATRRGRR